jgi:ferritin
MKKPKKLPQEIVDLLMPRLKDEFTAYYHYRALSNYCQGVGFMKAAKFFQGESDNELGHAKKIENYLVDWNVNPQLPKIDEPKIEFKGLLEGIEMSYSIEYALYEDYEDTSMKIFKEGDVCTFDFLQFFRTEQTAAVAEYSDMLNMLEGTDTASKFELLMLEEKLFGE